MKAIKFTQGIFFAFILFLVTACNKETVLPSSELPDAISSWIQTHFPDNAILQIIKDVDGFTRTYDISLEGNIQLEFNRKGNIIDIDSDTRLPDSVIPIKILSYVTTNFPSQFITDWELDDRNQKVGLDNGLDLVFSKDGDFLRIDD
jgi:hypothetical protein